MLKWLWVSVLVVVADQLSKLWVTATFNKGETLALLPVFNLTLVHNPGASFGFLGEAGGWQRWLFTLVAVGVSVWLVIWLKSLKPGQRWLPLALTLILGGALGNLWDRLYLGYVVDFLDFYVGSWHWPAFNIADTAIFIGAVMLIIDSLFLSREEKQEVVHGQ